VENTDYVRRVNAKTEFMALQLPISIAWPQRKNSFEISAGHKPIAFACRNDHAICATSTILEKPLALPAAQ
jgi:hypothetical protein